MWTPVLYEICSSQVYLLYCKLQQLQSLFAPKYRACDVIVCINCFCNMLTEFTFIKHMPSCFFFRIFYIVYIIVCLLAAFFLTAFRGALVFVGTLVSQTVDQWNGFKPLKECEPCNSCNTCLSSFAYDNQAGTYALLHSDGTHGKKLCSVP